MRAPGGDGLDRLVSVARAAEVLDVSRATLYRGLPGLDPVRVGRSVKFRRSDVERIVRGERPGTGPDAAARDRLAQALGDALKDVLRDAMGADDMSVLGRIERGWNEILDGWEDEGGE